MGSEGRKNHKRRFRPIPPIKRAHYRRKFRNLLRRYLPRSHQLRIASFGSGPLKFENLFCRLMHRQHLAQDLNARPRNHCLLLDKHVGPPSGQQSTIPSYFRKRILRYQQEQRAKKENEERVVVVDEDECESTYSDDAVLLDEEDREQQRHPEIPDPTKFSILKGEIKEYCAIQEKVQIVLSMLKTRVKELEDDDDVKHESEAQNSQVNVEPAVEDALVKIEPELQCDDVLNSFVGKYYGDDDSQSDSDGESDKVEEVVPKPEIVFVDAEAFDDESQTESKTVAVNCKQESLPEKSLKELSKEDLLDPTLSHVKLEPIDKKNSVVDTLFSRFNLTLPVTPPKCTSSSTLEDDEKVKSRLRDRRKIPAPRYVDDDEEPKPKNRPSKIFGKIHKTHNLELENTNSNSSTEFYGFDEGDVVKLDKPRVPGLLPTPIVKRSRPNAPFLAHGTTFEDIKIENRDDLFRDEGLISFGSLPPRLECPRRPDDMVRPRTVAQKRILLQKKNDVRYLMIDNEAKIFYELEKRSKNIEAELDFERMQELQDQNIPFTRDTWRALAWMRTEKGRYFFQSLKIDSHTVKLAGCKGNHATRKLGKKQHSAPTTLIRRQLSCRCPELPRNITFDLSAIAPPSSTVSVESDPDDIPDVPQSTDMKLLNGKMNRLVTSRPGPLSSKFRYDNALLHQTEDGAYLGPLEILEMPSVEIEVYPRIDRPLDSIVKPYLKMILPFRGITEKWARFAVSTLKTPDRNDADLAFEDRSFSFSLPYVNNQRRILIRRRVLENSSGTNAQAGSLEKFEKQLQEPLAFRKHLDDATNEGEVDQVELDCAKLLSDMTDAVAISLAEDIFIGNDPDCDYSKADKPVNKTEVTPDIGRTSENAAKSKRMLREMKRLNATIIETIPESDSTAEGNLRGNGSNRAKSKPCDEQYCRHGCICDVFSVKPPRVRKIPHCTSIDCVFGCHCGYDRKQQLRGAAGKDMVQTSVSGKDFVEGALSSEDVKYLREKATAKLAKEEREFTPTVILTTNSTVLVRNTETEARRHKKKPKKYDDYYNENNMKSLLNGVTPNDSRESSIEHCKSGKTLSPLERMRHSHVVLSKLQDLGEVEPWCMIHCLYRCYCRGNSITGKPFRFNEESNIVLPTPVAAAPLDGDPLLQVYEPRKRRLYSFEKSEPQLENPHEMPRKRDSSEESYKPWNIRRKKKRRTLDEKTSPDNTSDSLPSSARASLEDLQITDGQTCRRVIPVNRNFYKTRNYYRKERVLRETQDHKRKYPMAEKRLESLLDRCEKRFFEDRRRQLEEQAKRVLEKKSKEQRPVNASNAPEPIHIDIADEEEKLEMNSFLRPLLDTEKVLIYCGAKKYYVDKEAIDRGKVDLMSIAKKFRTMVYVIRKVPYDPSAKYVTFKLNNAMVTLKGRRYRKNIKRSQPQITDRVDLSSTSDDQETKEDDAAQKSMLNQVNSDIVHTMRHIREMLRKNTSTLNPPKKGILYLFRWEKFLQAYNADSLDVWDIMFQNGAQLVIITNKDARENMPPFKNSKEMRSARKSNFETHGMSVLTQMLLYQIDNPQTNNLSLVLFGTDNYWRFCGFIKSQKNFLDNGCEVRPTPASHPKLAPKINRYFEAYVASRKQQEQATVTVAPEQLNPAVIEPKPLPTVVPIPKPSPEEVQQEKLPTLKTNVKLMETKIKDLKNIAIPNVGTRRWFMLTIANDFSDIYIPSWKSCLTYGRVKQAIELANQYKKTVKLTSIVLKNSQEDVLPQIYAAPGQGECIFLGPYQYTQHIDLMLCQNVDGKMYTREEYQRNNHIVRTEHTTGSWLYMKPNQQERPSPAPTTSSDPPMQEFVRITPATQTPAITATTDDNDCVVIDDDKEDNIPSPAASTAVDSPQNANQLESLIHELYDDSDESNDVDQTTATMSTAQPIPQESPKNQLSQLVDKTLAESKQIKIISVTSGATALQNTIEPPNVELAPPAPIKTNNGNTNELKRKSTEAAPEQTIASQEMKKPRLSLPATVTMPTTTTDEVVCLDDDDDSPPAASTFLHKPKIPSSTTVLSSQQAALIASKINLLNPTQKGVVYNPSTGVLRIKRSLMNSLTGDSPVVVPTAESSQKAQLSSDNRRTVTVSNTISSSKVSPSTSAIVTVPTSSQGQVTQMKPPLTATEGVLRSNIPGMGLVPVMWTPKDIILKVRELSVKLQFVRLINFESAIILLNRFIRKNTYTFKPFSLAIEWKFEPRTTPLPPEENLINTISLRCVVTPDGIIDLYKANAIIAFQSTKPNFYEELLLLRLSILCCKKEQYEQEKCHKFFELIFEKASNTIKELTAASEALTTQSTFLREQQEERRLYLAKLKASSSVEKKPPATIKMVSKRVIIPKSILNRVVKPNIVDSAGPSKEAVIVIDDD